MIDALIGRAKKFPAIEQFALSEVLRLSQVADRRNSRHFSALLAGAPAHLYGQSHRQGFVAELGRSHPAPGMGRHELLGGRAYNYYYGVTHALDMFK